MKEPVLEPILRRLRVRQVGPYVRRFKNCRLLDVGCGWNASLLRALESELECGVGIDFKAPALNTNKLRTIEARLDTRLPFEDSSFDLVTMLAVLEHLDCPAQILEECCRVLRPGGGLLLTVPSKRAKPVLEFLAFRVGIVSRTEIEDHKQYFNKEDLRNLISKIPSLVKFEHKYFQLGLNNRVFVTRADVVGKLSEQRT